MRQQVILDTGSLVALMRKRDQFHQWAVQEWGKTQPPLLTCEAVLSETLFLLRDYPIAQEGIMEMLAQDIIIVAFNIGENIPQLQVLLSRYQSVPMSLADACLVRMSELNPQSSILTIDSDFQIYRKHREQVIPVVIPNSM
jgi:predicted nucleic acid-binding protein